MKNGKRKTAGFTLVELIVVIAILAILAGVGTVAYSGYVKKANQAVDQQLVADIKYAVELAFVSDPSFSGTEAIVLRQGQSAQVVSTDETPWLATAISNAFGADALTGMQLKYSGWGRGAAVAQETLKYFKDINEGDPLYAVVHGETPPSFANDVDDLFIVIRDTAIEVGKKAGANSGAELIQNAAELTAGTNAIPASNFANAWASSAWSSDILMGEGNGNDYNGNAGDLTGNSLSQAIANAGVIKARNTALACYLRDNGFPEVYDLFANYTYGSSAVPKDTAATIFSSEPDEADEAFGNAVFGKLCADLGNPTAEEINKMDHFTQILYGYFSMTLDDNGHPVQGDISLGQAYKDGLAYYTMMSTVNAVNNTENVSDDLYWDEMAGAVSLYGSIARGETVLDDLTAVYDELGTITDNAVVITVMAANGTLAVNISPATAMAG